jgi:hypothetical protein
MVKDNTPETILNNIVTVLEELAKNFSSYQQALVNFQKEVGELKKRVGTLEAENTIDSSDAKFMVDMVARLKAIPKELDKKI